jgi:drug/metabolite transporter (DMT)-like permease
MGQIYALLAVFLFIVSHSQVKVLSHFPVAEVVFFRAFGILLCALPIMFFMKVSPLGVNRKKLFLRGAFGTIAIFSYFTTLQNLPLPNAVVLAQLSPFFAVFFAGILLKEKNGILVYSLFALALCGVFLIKDPALNFSMYYVIGIVGAAFAALSYNFVRALRTTDHPLVVLSWFQFVLLPVSLFALAAEGFVVPAPYDYQPIFLLVTFSFLAQVCLTLAYQKAVMSKAASVNFLSIPLSVVVASFFFQEDLKTSQLFGIALVFTAVLINTVFRSSLERFLQRNTSSKPPKNT